MKNEQISIEKLICEIHVGLERQGPGSPDATKKALSFIGGLNWNSRTVDLGCGTGGQTMLLAQNIPGKITGVDLFTDFIDVFNNNAAALNLNDRVNGIAASMDALSFGKEEFDLIWSEGAIDCIGFEKGINYWNGFLKSGGYIALTSASWFTEQRPAEIEKWWVDAVPDISTVAQNVLLMQKAGYVPVATFTLPDDCWTEHYFAPRKAGEKALLEKYAGNETVTEFIKNDEREVELFEKYKQYYGYAFYIGKKI